MHGVGEYLAFASVVAIIAHSLVRWFAVACLTGAALCSFLTLFFEAWAVGFRVNIAWFPPMFVIGALLALPLFCVIGLPFRAIRASRLP
jgi:hypothetical protein